MLFLLLILPCLSSLFQPLNAKVEAPNYHFNIDTLYEFLPGKSKAEIDKKFSRPIMMTSKGEIETLKYFVKHERYQFPVLLQMKSGVVQDFFARIPSYFLHDVFFQSLVNKLGKQSIYRRTGEEAYYIWELDSNRHVYSATCTITCFPIFYTVYSTKNGTPSLLDLMKKSLLKK